MIEMERGQKLHERSCRGEYLSVEEQAELDAWYSELDAGEAAMLYVDVLELQTNEELRAQVNLRLHELQVTLGEIRRIEESNAVLRKQNEELKRHLVTRGILAA